MNAPSSDAAELEAALLDTVDKQEVTTALLDRASAWLREHGMNLSLIPL